MELVHRLIKGFVKNFVPKKFQVKWQDALINSNDNIYSISPFDFWNPMFENDFLKAFSEYKYLPEIQKNYNNICFVIHFGHDEERHDFCLLSDIYEHRYYVLEGIVIINEKLALIFNHHNGSLICNLEK